MHGLKFTVSTDVLSSNENVGNGTLRGHNLEGVLDVSSTLNLIEFNNGCFNTLLLEESFSAASKGTVRFAVNKDLAVVDVRLDGSLVRAEVCFNHSFCIFR